MEKKGMSFNRKMDWPEPAWACQPVKPDAFLFAARHCL